MSPFAWFVLGSLLVLNAWMTRRIGRAPDEYLQHKGILVVTVWCMPFLGALIARAHLRHHVPGEAWRRHAALCTERRVRDDAPQVVHAAGTDWDLHAHLRVHEGLPMLDWTAVDRWRATLPGPIAQAHALDAARRGWLLHMRDAIGPDAALHESADTRIVSSLDPAVVLGIDAEVVATRERVARLLGPRLAVVPPEPIMLIVLDSEAECERYTAASRTLDAEAFDLGAAFVAGACPHFVATRRGLRSLDAVLLHPLACHVMSHLHLPTWLRNGIALHLERQLAPLVLHSQVPLDTHQEFWTEERIQGFWSGALFEQRDDASTLSLDLASSLVAELYELPEQEAFHDFVRHASPHDAGVASAREHLGIDLGALVCAWLEVEASMDWSPRAVTQV